MTYRECLAYLYGRLPVFQRQGSVAYKADLTNTRKLLELLRNPEKRFKSIHIAGTNGKGSSAHGLASILQAAGYRTGLYTSPHLKEFTERIRIDGVEIPQQQVIDFVERMKPGIEQVSPSFFEVTVAMAFDYFSAQQVDIAVIETGMGGRLDSTNVIEPELSLITNIGFDHMEFLGDTLPLIAREKAGIIKPGRPVIIGTSQEETTQVFENMAEGLHSPIRFADQIYTVTIKNRKESSLTVRVLKHENPHFEELDIDIAADYFMLNIPGVLCVIDVLCEAGWRIDERAIFEGLSNVKRLTGLKGRYQILDMNPMVIADVSHNQDGMRQLLRQIRENEGGTLRVIYGTVRDKRFNEILELFPISTKFYFTQADIPRALPVDELQNRARQIAIDGRAYKNVNVALNAARRDAQKNDIILITGSTFVVAELKEL